MTLRRVPAFTMIAIVGLGAQAEAQAPCPEYLRLRNEELGEVGDRSRHRPERAVDGGPAAIDAGPAHLPHGWAHAGDAVPDRGPTENEKSPAGERGSRQQAADEVLWLRARASSLNVTA
jgi:hypothetical protein